MWVYLHRFVRAYKTVGTTNLANYLRTVFPYALLHIASYVKKEIP